jgi:Flp pilus assembly protein TadD
MTPKLIRTLLAAAACALWLNACGSATKLSDPLQADGRSVQPAESTASQSDPASTGSVRVAAGDVQSDTATKRRARATDEELSLGKKHFAAGNFTLAERHFRRAAELHPGDVESWLGLAAAYDRLRRFDQADGAYAQALKIAGPTGEILNNHGYSYMLRGDFRRARETLVEAQAKDPDNAYIKNNLELLETKQRKGQAAR